MKIIGVVGGVISGVGKGVATASIGLILKKKGYKVTAIKIDPYINCDAGTLRPTEHGEVWVTSDGGEIDQDLGTYERFLEKEIPKKNNITTGKIYKSIIEKERKGKYLGKTVQFIPHVPEEISERIIDTKDNNDFVLVEIGGTIGDYENIPFLLSLKNLKKRLGDDAVCCVLVTYMPVPHHIKEMKTKPTQHAIKALNEYGMNPDFLICRGIVELDKERRNKIEKYAGIDSGCIISAPDVDSIYEVPLKFESDNLGEKLLDYFGLKDRSADWTSWQEKLERIKNPANRVDIAMVGKYIDSGDFTLKDSYISIDHALKHAGAFLDTGVKMHWIDSKTLENNHERVKKLDKYDGIIVPGGFGTSGIQGKINAIQHVRNNNIPFLGLCLGFQLAVVEYARNICGMKGAHSTEMEPDTDYPVIDILDEQKRVLENEKYGASMRLGEYVAMLRKGKVLELYKHRMKQDKEKIDKLKNMDGQKFRLGKNDRQNAILERHRHRYEANPMFVKELKNSGLIFSGVHKRVDGTELMEFLELTEHKFFIATQAHPEFKTSLFDPAPLFLGFVKSCLE